MAQKFDPARLELSGNPITVASGLEALGWYSASHNGVLTVESNPNPLNFQLTWFNRKGEPVRSLGSPDLFSTPVISPDGTQIAVEREVRGVGFNIWTWVLDQQPERLGRFTLGTPAEQLASAREDQMPVWSRDGSFIAFTTEIPGEGWFIRRKRTDGVGDAEDLITLPTESYTTDWSPNGKYIVYESFDQQTRWDSWLLPVSGNHKPETLLKTTYNERQVQFSPNGEWIAYISNLSGRNEVYVQKFPISGEKWHQISNNGGAQPRWRGDGRELFYVTLDQKIMAVPIKTSPRFEPGLPVELFQARLPSSQGLDNARNYYDVSADGQRFIINSVLGPRTGGPGEPDSALITVIMNWTPQ